ncbi:MAG: hypothetical protein KAT09_05555 [Candidatus Aegiribacteria sp.]|nr:hypothetical protein [Candidatus Aegiribacteria sp.]
MKSRLLSHQLHEPGPASEYVTPAENHAKYRPELAERFRRNVEVTGMINIPQFIFGLHYSAAEMHLSNEEYIEAIKRAGLDFFSCH